MQTGQLPVLHNPRQCDLMVNCFAKVHYTHIFYFPAPRTDFTEGHPLTLRGIQSAPSPANVASAFYLGRGT